MCPIAQQDDTRTERVHLDEFELGLVTRLLEESTAAAPVDRVDEQPVLVDKARRFNDYDIAALISSGCELASLATPNQRI